MKILAFLSLSFIATNFAQANNETLKEVLRNHKQNIERLFDDIDDLKSSNKIEIDSLKNVDRDINSRLRQLEKTLKQLNDSRNSFNEENQKKIDQLEFVFNQLEKSSKALENYIRDLSNATANNSKELMNLKKLFEDFQQKKLGDHIPDDFLKVDQILNQIQSFTKISRLSNGRNGQSLIYNFQLSVTRNGKEIPLAGRQLVVGEQILDGQFKQSFTIDTDEDGVALFEAGVELRREMNKRQSYFVVKFMGDALLKGSETSKFR